MTKIDIFSGFLGAGKTTLIKKLIAEAYHGEKLVLIENEFGEIGIDGGFLREAGITVNEMNSGCICCSLVGDFAKALEQVLEAYHPDRILIEPSGVGKLSDVVGAVKPILSESVLLNSCTAVADVSKCKLYLKNFGEFYRNQIEAADTVILSRTANAKEEKIAEALELLRALNPNATVITTPWDQLDGALLQKTLERQNHAEQVFAQWTEEATCPTCGHIHHHHDEDCDCHEHPHHHHDGDCDCHEHHHHHDEDCDCHEHHHHHHDEDCDCHEHHHHHHHDEDCDCHEHHHHHADEVFSSIGLETAHRYTEAELKNALNTLDDTERCGTVLRAKGIVAATDGRWLHFDYVPGELELRYGSADVIGRLCVIGSDLHEDAIKALFAI